MTLIINIHGRDYRVPPALEPEPELCAAFDTAIRAQLHAAATQAQIPQQTVQRKKLTLSGEYEYDEKGQVVTVAERHWLELPDALHDAVQIPTAEDILPPPPVVVAPVVPPTPEEE